jgi:Immunity protein 35
MITKPEAVELVSDRLRQLAPPNDPFVIVDSDTIERQFGWVFFYNSKKFLETREFSYRLAGNGPIIVNKHDGSVEFCGTNEPPLKIIEDYERKLAG